jgi:hypothetical protein
MSLRTNRDVEGWYEPQTRQWSQHHILYPDGGGEGSVDHATPRPNYLHDLPLPVPEILHFFGFNLELGIRELWEKQSRAYVNPEWKDYPYTIDLLGSYSADDRTVRLYEPTIQKAAKRHDWDEDGLAEVVRVHELAHALHHQGAPASARRRLWGPRDTAQINGDFDQERQALFRRPTDLDLFLALRNRWFQGLRSHDKETVAQAATAIYVDYLDEVYGPRLREKKSLKTIFWELMEYQPREYRLTGILPKNLSWRIGGGVIRECLRQDWAREIPGPIFDHLSTVFNRHLAQEVQGNRLTTETHVEFVMEMMGR